MNVRALIYWFLALLIFLTPASTLLAQRPGQEDVPTDAPLDSALDSPGDSPTDSPPDSPTIYIPAISSEASGASAGDDSAAPLGSAVEIALRYIREHRSQWGLSEADLADILVTDHYTTQHNGVTHVYLRQRYGGIELFGGNFNINIAADGTVLSAHSDFIPGLAEKINTTTPARSAVEALGDAAAYLGVSFASQPVQLATVEANSEANGGGNAHKVFLSSGGISRSDIPAQLVFEQVQDGKEVRLAWNMSINLPEELSEVASWPYLRVDAVSGEILSKDDLIGHDSYRVFDLPTESPQHGLSNLRANPANLTASPFGWHDTNGVAGAEFTDTRGNNVFAQEDFDNNDTGGFRPSQSSAGLVFDYAFDGTLAPDGGTNLSAAIVNLFHTTNILHDILYQYGFDEASGNFQQNNYGKGGTGNDAVGADAQDGSGTNNANFSWTVDGTSPRMQMYVWTPADPDRDSDFDNGVIAHEYGHGLSGRLTGGPATLCLFNEEQMGEGWSDFLALVLTAKASDTSTLARGMGTYVLNQATNGPGIRPHPYSTNMAINPHTYASTNSLTEPHETGSVWAAMLWELYWGLVDEYGFDADLYQGTGGNNLALQLVIDALKLQPCSPGFVDGRDAILLADQTNNGGSNQCIIWNAFAKRGLGYSAAQGDVDNIRDAVEAFDLPDQCKIALTKQASPFTFHAGDQVTYTVAITNESPSVANSVVLIDSIPQAMSYVPASASDGGTLAGDTLTWNVGTLNSGQSVVRTFRATAKPNIQGLLLDDDMESGATQWTATGLWHQEQDSALCGASHSPTTSWYFGRSDTCTYDTGARSAGSLTTAAPISVPAGLQSTLTFWSAEETEGDDSYDLRNVLISTDGTTFSHLRNLTNETGDWVEVSIDLSSYAGENIWLRFTFDSIDNSDNNFRGWYVDDVRITTAIANTTRITASGRLIKAYTLNSPLLPIPNAVADSATTNEDTPITINVLANDSDVEKLPLSVASLIQPGHGTATTNGTTVTYTPAANFNGSDSFTYRVGNGNGGFSDAIVSMTVTPISDGPETVTLNGPTTVTVNSAQSFSALVDFVASQAGPLLPTTFTWEATDLAPVVHTGSDSDQVSFTWTTPGSKSLSVSAVNADGEASKSITVVVSEPPAVSEPAAIVVTANPTIIAANGTSTSTIAATVTDASDQPMPNQTVNFSSDHGTITASSLTDVNGVAVATLTSEASVVTATVTATINGLSDETQVLFGGGNLQGSIFKDSNHNGQQESDEPGLAGVIITLTPQPGQATASQIAARAQLSNTTVTDNDGDFSFTALPFGVYQVTMVAPSGYVFLTEMAATITIDRLETITLPARGILYRIAIPMLTKK